jgi:hypothetical protein
MNLSCLNVTSLIIFNCLAYFLHSLKLRVLLKIQYEPFVIKGVDSIDFLASNR